MPQSLSLRRLCTLSGLAFILSLCPQVVIAQHWDGPSPYGQNFAPDVKSVDAGWDVSYPSFEGNSSYPPPILDGVDGFGNDVNSTSTVTARAAKDFYLRIMPLGASITEGVRSTDGNGYRKWLRQQLRWKGWKVNMVGSKRNGNMADKDNEGHPGWIIKQIHDAFLLVANMKPNLVLINAGTNDCGQNIDPGNAGVRMKAMIDDVYARLPGVTVVLSTLVKSRGNDTCAASVSQQFRDLVTNTYRGQRIGLADIYSAISMSQVSDDGIHPTDEGYKLFAAVWWDAISKLENVIQPPSSDGTVDDSASGSSNCAKVAGNARGPVRTQAGSGHDDGKYVHNRVERGAIESARIQKGNDPRTITEMIPFNIFFANLVMNDPNADRASALDDLIQVYTSLSGVTTYFMRQNLGGGVFGANKIINFGMDCPDGSGYAFGDFNNDGLDDFYCIKTGASVHISLNRGGSPPTFESIGQVVPASSGWNILNVRIADIDGDGRADFCLVNGVDVKCSRNGGQGDSYGWQGFSTQDGIRGIVFNQKNASTSSFMFGDINGDFRSDLFIVGDNGNVETWTNWRGRESGIVPEWSSSGITHQGQPETDIRNNIKFGKIYGSNRLDYIYIKEEEDWFDVRVWENTGGGGTKRKGDGVFYCDMRGTGSDDYVWIYMDGHSNEVYGNTHNPPYWDPNIKITISVPGPRTGVHLADWTGNGRCDVLVQNKATGALTLWENQWNSGTKTLTFANRGVVASPGCTEGWGVGIFDRGMRIADMDGDGRADIMCLEKGGRITGWLNRASGLFNAGQFKLTEGWDRANLRFADVENSGRADLIWLDKYTGAGRVWKNNGYAGPNGGGGGSSFSWTSRGVLYSPIDRGECMNFANLGGLGRADLIQVYPGTNEAYTFFNECGRGGAGGDDGPVGNPGLPDYSTNAVQVNFNGNTCTANQRATLNTEFNQAYEMAQVTKDNLQSGNYYDYFFDQGSRNTPGFADRTRNVLDRIHNMLQGTHPDYVILVTCDQSRPGCARKGQYAHMNADTQVMNFCNKFFDDQLGDESLKVTAALLNDCGSDFDLRTAQRARAATIIHECTHTRYAMDGDPCDDYAYGFIGCSRLPNGLFDRSCARYASPKYVKCPGNDGKEGYCPSQFSTQNADTYAFIAAGVFFEQKCGRPVPYPALPPPLAIRSGVGKRGIEAITDVARGTSTNIGVGKKQNSGHPRRSTNDFRETTKAVQQSNDGRQTHNISSVDPMRELKEKRQTNSCPVMDDYLIIDGPDDDSVSVTGYVHFGDSYASGMGTGTTSGDSCRVGSSNSKLIGTTDGDLLYQWLPDNGGISYERHSCSGDTIDGLNGQVGKWGNMGMATVGTLTIGGNDVGFSDLVYYCVITPNTWYWPEQNRKYCLDAEKKANDFMDDSSTNGLRAKLKNAYLSILEKSGRGDFDLYVAGYPAFFDEQTTDCNRATFHYWYASNRPSAIHGDRLIMMTTDLRVELDALVTKLNGVILGAIQDANAAHGTSQVHFVDVVERFADGNHRWCENGVADPDPSRQDTWFFLSAWPDVNYDTTAVESSEVRTLVSQGQIKLPDHSTCRTDLSSITTGADPYLLAMCRVAEEVADNPTGPQASRLNQANTAIAAGDVSSQDIPWYVPTRQIKTFHPRSPGMVAYRDAIIHAMQTVGSV